MDFVEYLSQKKFQRYDYRSSSHFSGDVNDKSVSVYDYEHSKYFNYAI